ncbi:protease-4 [Virgibacillus natechei]|uniref:Protease-4 n=1 Tax=Virgibacillus natechei TaxID=1216297 RepID=A0ABS4II25_9BACI|nr:signal peptide peptidase SppA [Virgibacillus natechei]MBP1970106.1 protease-4 [Virgibacillus natechei]UZD14185.1 signal peptide peptidase SppA [Virgibacillus natechei]
MNKKRWFALLAVAVLIIFSLGFRMVTSAVTADFDELFNVPDSEFGQDVIEEGAPNNKIAVVNLNGIIQQDDVSPLMNTGAYNHDRFLKMLDEAAEDNTVNGIIVRVNTPGGGVVESAEIHDKIVSIQEEQEKPVYVSMGNTAASGGYYIAAPADKIVAHEATMTGSIGVIMESFNFAEFADEHGIDFNTITSGEYKDIMSASREMTDDEREILQEMIDDLHGDFVQVIVDGREMSESEVRDVSDGRIYTGSQAQEVDLVDELGSMDDTIAMMKEDYDLNDASVIEYQSGFGLNQFLGGTVQNMFDTETDIMGIKDLLRQSNAPRAMYLYTE